MERKTIWKWFFVWDFEKEEQWLNEMAAQGWVLVGVGFCRYEFERCEPEKYIIRMQMYKGDKEYIQFIEDTGAEYIGKMVSWIYFRRDASLGAFDLFSDIDSKIEHLKKIGYMLLNLFPKSSNVSSDVCTSLFGSTSILTLTSAEVWLSAGLSVAVLVFFILFYNKLFAVTFDEDFARSAGVNVKLYNLLIAVVIAVIIVLAMNLVGSLLISALIIFPPISAMRVCRSFRSVTICSALLSVSCAVIGMLISILSGTPVGSTIVAADILVFFITCILSAFGIGKSKG